MICALSIGVAYTAFRVNTQRNAIVVIESCGGEAFWNEERLNSSFTANLWHSITDIKIPRVESGEDFHDAIDALPDLNHIEITGNSFAGIARMRSRFPRLEIDHLDRFYDAIHFNDSSAVQDCIDNGSDVNADLDINGGWSPLQLAAARRNVGIVKMLLENGADVDATDNGNRYTPLHWAIEDGSPDIAEALLLAGADPNYRCDGWTAIDSLFGHRYVGRLRILPNREFINFERLLIQHGGIETCERSEERKESSRNSPHAK